ncbi:hypothetical protein AB4268_09780 [Vibrio cyclitrophicus]|uniref:hypothetical protein n=1 Tax=Vibrio cyclitrophicus TaxID=47951 RepID=UPI000C817F0F|nr:hypothetical protein [Vibrio cyclitrophicus]PMK23537.1 hypothetical protein BCU04_15305 [Vibrio cyclitrophicus]
MKDIKFSYLKGGHWKLLSVAIIGTTLLEFLYFGFPLYGGVNYKDFGFPFLHHVVVSGWILIFIHSDKKIVRTFFVLFALISPVLYLNRDALLMSLCAIVFLFYFRGRMNLKLLLLSFLIFSVVFTILGNTRTVDVFDIISMPINDAFYSINDYLKWPVLYLTISSFNMGNNMDSESFILYDYLLNTYPEPYVLTDYLGIFAFPFYFISLAVILIFVRALGFKYQDIFALYAFLFYQFMMGGIFAPKFYTTNTLFVVVIFITFTFLKKSNEKVS